MSIKSRFALVGLLFIGIAALAVAPSQMVLKNQYGEQFQYWVLGSAMPLVPGTGNIVTLSGSGAPVDGTTGLNVAGKGSLYIRTSNGSWYTNTGTYAAPVWTAAGTGNTSTLLTGFSAAAGALASTDTILGAFNKIVLSTTSPSLTFDHSVGAKTVVVKQVGKQVLLHVPAGAISDGLGTVCASTALASGFRPTAAVTFPALVIDNGTTRKIGQLVVGSDGVLTFSVLGAGFTNAAAAGWDATAVSYSIP